MTYIQYTPHMLDASLLLEVISENQSANLLHMIWISILQAQGGGIAQKNQNESFCG